VPGRFKDYIAIPKPNMYQSLHTTVIGSSGERVEIQIRTEDMHKVADEGIAAHWAYKAGRAAQEKDAQRFAWLRQLLEWQQDLKDPKEFLDTVKVDLFTDEVFVFTPKGDVKSLPRGSTPVDLAFAIHTEVGTRCVGAKCNGKIVPLRYKLKNGDTVEILTSTTAKPSKDWLSFVKTSRAPNKIRNFIRDSQRERSLEIGRELCERELKRFGLALNKITKSGDLEKAAQELGYRSDEALVSAVGYGKLGVHEIVKVLVPPEKLTAPAPEANGHDGEAPSGGGLRLTEIFKRVAARTRQAGGVRISGLDDVLVRYGKCCSPVPGDAIVGFVTRGRGVTVHTRGCPKALESDPERRVDVSWDVGREFKRNVTVRVITGDRKGLLAEMSETFSDKGVSISHADCRVTGPDRAVNTFEVAVQDLTQLKDVIAAIEKIEGVKSVERM
jgi:GTP pyrophosphokinase